MAPALDLERRTTCGSARPFGLRTIGCLAWSRRDRHQSDSSVATNSVLVSDRMSDDRIYCRTFGDVCAKLCHGVTRRGTSWLRDEWLPTCVVSARKRTDAYNCMSAGHRTMPGLRGCILYERFSRAARSFGDPWVRVHHTSPRAMITCTMKSWYVAQKNASYYAAY